MKITTIGYGRGTYFLDGQNTNEYLYLEANLEEGEDYDYCLRLLQDQVSNRIGVENAVERLDALRMHLDTQVKKLEADAKAAGERWQKIKEFYEKIKISLEDSEDDPIPF